jgi:hypothetical protein
VAQVNSEPGKNQIFANVTVSSAVAEVGTTDTKVKAAAIIVPYSQIEPGTTNDPALKPKRS